MDIDQPALESSPPVAPPPPTPPTLRQRAQAALAALRRPSVLIAVLALLLLGWQWLETRARLEDLQQQLAKRLAESDTLAKEDRILAKQTQEVLQSLQGKVGGLDIKLAEAQGQQLALEAMYQELSRSRDERLLAEIEQSVSIATQQLQLAGNVEVALIALQSADARLSLAGQGQPRFLPLRKLINRDIERLKALPLADVSGIALKLESVIAAVDKLPLAFEQRPRPVASAKVPAADKKENEISSLGFWQELGRDLWAEAKQLIRIERIDRSDPALLSPTHAFFLRENLKLRLVDARLALLQRDSKTYREDLRQARDWLERYFDTREKPVQSAVATLKGVSSIDLNLELPTLSETLAALRNMKLAREKNVK